MQSFYQNSLMNFKLFHYWQLPVLSGLVWWAMLISLLSLWASEGFPNYSYESKPDQRILYISDIGAGKFQPIFIIGSSLQGALFILSLSLELRLRLTGRLRRHFQLWAIWCMWGSLALAIVGQTGIILVAIFDNKAYHNAHVSLLVVYIVFVGVSALLNVLATAALERSRTSKRHVRLGLWFKIVWFCLEFILAVAFVGLQATYKNAPAVLEWIISFIYPFYQMILAWDLWPALGKPKDHYPRYHEPSLSSTTSFSSNHKVSGTSSDGTVFESNDKGMPHDDNDIPCNLGNNQLAIAGVFPLPD